jgi:hypothetical protein
LKEIEESFSVKVDDSSGKWTTTALTGIKRGMEKFQGAIGKDGFQRLFGGVTFSIGADADNGMDTTGNRDVRLGKDLLDGKSHINYIKRETVHELAHIWDKSCRDCMSEGMMDVTVSGYDTHDNDDPDDDTYEPGGIPPSDHAKKNHREDWAESVRASLFPSFDDNPFWDKDRRNWVKQALDDIKKNQNVLHSR